jgi:DNA-binding HxlR family transcriptional regulator
MKAAAGTIAAQDGIKNTRWNRRVLTVLLTGAGNVGDFTIMRLGGVSSAGVSLTLARLQRAGWVTHAQEDAPPGRLPRRFHSLTPRGRYGAMKLLDLEEDAR